MQGIICIDRMTPTAYLPTPYERRKCFCEVRRVEHGACVLECIVPVSASVKYDGLARYCFGCDSCAWEKNWF